jgi:hypothetical protein
MQFRLEIVLLILAAMVSLWWIHRNHRRRVRADRGACFRECMALLSEPRLSQDDIDFPVLEGWYQGRRVRLQPIVDHVVVRKVPSLWLLVTVFGDVPYAATFDLLARPQNTEFYSPSSRLTHDVRLPRGWPGHAIIRTDDPGRMVPLELIDRHIGMFDDSRTKELIVAPHGVRIVYQAIQAERIYYMVLRQAEFRDVILPASLVQELLDRAVALLKDVTIRAEAA